MNKKGSITLYLTFIFVAIIIVLISAVFAPFGVLFNTKMYEAGEDIMLQANESISNIDNTTVRDTLLDTVGGGLNAVEDNITVNNALFQYGWVFVIILTGLIAFLFVRRLVEVQQGQGGLI